MGLLEAFLRKKRTDDDGEVVKNIKILYIVLEPKITSNERNFCSSKVLFADNCSYFAKIAQK